MSRSCVAGRPAEEALPEYDTFVRVPLLVQVWFVSELPESEADIGESLSNLGRAAI
ncbi:hypothetical protein ACFVTE_24250 [Arthrobacter sp. NPDC058097]|uniref:hypothetical protein n=1 Tax=Arthrobacter sp. NPDC058097 TaxID=3346340 RepID=UPI0036DBDA8A